MNIDRPVIALRPLLLLLLAIPVSFPSSAQKNKGAVSPAASPAAAATPAASSAPVEVEWLAYSSLDKVLQKVATYACGTMIAKDPNVRVVVLDTPALQALEAYDAFFMQAESINGAFADMAPQSGAGGGIDDFADITGAVTATAVASTSETSSNFTIQDPTAALVLLRKLLPAGCPNAYYAGVYAVSDVAGAKANFKVYKADPKAGKEIVANDLPTVPEELDNLATNRAQTLETIITLPSGQPTPNTCYATATPVQGAPSGTKTNASGLTAVSSSDPCVSAFNTLDSTYNAFLTSLSTANSTTGQTAISAAKQGYPLRAIFQLANTKPVLGIYLNVAAAGGTQQDRKNLISAVFTGDWIRYSGGVSVNVVVFQVTGTASKVLFSDLIKFRTPLTKISAPSDKKGLNAGDNLDELNR
jgi:hypothetical protein